MTPEVGKYYWVRFYRDDADWRPAQRMEDPNNGNQWWEICGEDIPYHDTELNILGPELIPPK